MFMSKEIDSLNVGRVSHAWERWYW